MVRLALQVRKALLVRLLDLPGLPERRAILDLLAHKVQIVPLLALLVQPELKVFRETLVLPDLKAFKVCRASKVKLGQPDLRVTKAFKVSRANKASKDQLVRKGTPGRPGLPEPIAQLLVQPVLPALKVRRGPQSTSLVRLLQLAIFPLPAILRTMPTS